MLQPTYAELLRHPEWQKKRLRIMERDGFECRECGDKETTLNVHHGYYTKGAKPWEYPDESLQCLCEKCHEKRHALIDSAKRDLGTVDLYDLAFINGFLNGLRLKHAGYGASLSIGTEHACVAGFARAWNRDEEDVFGVLRDGVVSYADLTALPYLRLTAAQTAPLDTPHRG